MAYDPADGDVVMFGGYCHSSGSENPGCSDTWIFSHGQWTELHPTHHPGERLTTQMAYDSADHYIVLFGGMDE